jgi:hypothetical protein
LLPHIWTALCTLKISKIRDTFRKIQNFLSSICHP